MRKNVRFPALIAVAGWATLHSLTAGDRAQAQNPTMPLVRVVREGPASSPLKVAMELYTLTNGRITAKVTNYGAALVALDVPDRTGKISDVVLGFDSLAEYQVNKPYFGATVGRFANRIGGAKFTLNGKDYQLAANNGVNSLHGGVQGFNKHPWTAEEVTPTSVRLALVSPDGQEGYPGNLRVQVTYTVTPDDALRIDYEAKADAATPINLTHHSYFNLAGPQSKSVLDHVLLLNADTYTPGDEGMIPTGKIDPVAGTPLDFTRPTRIGERIKQIPGEPGGYDHNFVIRDGGKTEAPPVLAARVTEPTSGRTMEVYTTEPGIQFYSGNFLDATDTGKGGVKYGKNYGFCLETQHYPDSVHQPSFPTTILQPGQTYTQTTLYKFSAH